MFTYTHATMQRPPPPNPIACVLQVCTTLIALVALVFVCMNIYQGKESPLYQGAAPARAATDNEGLTVVEGNGSTRAVGSKWSGPKLVRTGNNIYAHPDDNEVQCMANYPLCIGNEFSARNEPHLRQVGITHIVSAIGELGPPFADISYHTFFVEDSNVDMLEHWDASYEFIEAALKADPSARVLVHCAAGVSRSSSTIIYYLMRKHNMTYGQAFLAVQATRHVIQPNVYLEAHLGRLSEAWATRRAAATVKQEN